jgi:hypothetical protein
LKGYFNKRKSQEETEKFLKAKRLKEKNGRTGKITLNILY